LLAAFAEDMKGVIHEFRIAPDSNEIIAALVLYRHRHVPKCGRCRSAEYLNLALNRLAAAHN
jgi:hypothetical protein